MGYIYNALEDVFDIDTTLALTTLDARYLKLDCSNDPLTSSLEITGNLTINSTGGNPDGLLINAATGNQAVLWLRENSLARASWFYNPATSLIGFGTYNDAGAWGGYAWQVHRTTKAIQFYGALTTLGLLPTADNTSDIGTSSYYYKDIYSKGTIKCNALAAWDSGDIDLTGSFKPVTTGVYDIGSSTKKIHNIYCDAINPAKIIIRDIPTMQGDIGLKTLTSGEQNIQLYGGETGDVYFAGDLNANLNTINKVGLTNHYGNLLFIDNNGEDTCSAFENEAELALVPYGSTPALGTSEGTFIENTSPNTWGCGIYSSNTVIPWNAAATIWIRLYVDGTGMINIGKSQEQTEHDNIMCGIMFYWAPAGNVSIVPYDHNGMVMGDDDTGSRPAYYDVKIVKGTTDHFAMYYKTVAAYDSAFVDSGWTTLEADLGTDDTYRGNLYINVEMYSGIPNTPAQYFRVHDIRVSNMIRGSIGNTTDYPESIYTGKEYVNHIGELTGSHTITFDNSITITNDIKGETKCWDAVIINPNGAYGVDTQIPIALAKSALTVTKLQVSLNTTAQEVAGDLKYADDLTSFTNAAVINDFDTTSGVRTDTSITSGSVAAGKWIYLQFDSEPNAAITFMIIHIEWDFD